MRKSVTNVTTLGTRLVAVWWDGDIEELELEFENGHYWTIRGEFAKNLLSVIGYG
jgi:hypothetical protein